MKLFDLDGTLIDSNGIWVDVDLRFLGRHGLTPTEEYTYAVGHSIFPVAAGIHQGLLRSGPHPGGDHGRVALHGPGMPTPMSP